MGYRAKVVEVLLLDGPEKRVAFVCPACRDVERQRHGGEWDGGTHEVPVTGPHAWQFDGNLAAPTLAPSLLLRYDYGPNPNREHYVCHSFVRNGRIEYCGDCTHALAGQSVELPEFADPTTEKEGERR